MSVSWEASGLFALKQLLQQNPTKKYSNKVVISRGFICIPKLWCLSRHKTLLELAVWRKILANFASAKKALWREWFSSRVFKQKSRGCWSGWSVDGRFSHEAEFQVSIHEISLLMMICQHIYRMVLVSWQLFVSIFSCIYFNLRPCHAGSSLSELCTVHVATANGIGNKALDSNEQIHVMPVLSSKTSFKVDFWMGRLELLWFRVPHLQNFLWIQRCHEQFFVQECTTLLYNGTYLFKNFGWISIETDTGSWIQWNHEVSSSLGIDSRNGAYSMALDQSISGLRKNSSQCVSRVWRWNTIYSREGGEKIKW